MTMTTLAHHKILMTKCMDNNNNIKTKVVTELHSSNNSNNNLLTATTKVTVSSHTVQLLAAHLSSNNNSNTLHKGTVDQLRTLHLDMEIKAKSELLRDLISSSFLIG